MPAWRKLVIMSPNKESTTQVSLSVIVLCYKAGQDVFSFVENIIDCFKNQNIENFEIILVGNYAPGSIDETPAIVQNISQKYHFVKYSALPKKGMMGWDMRSGLELSTGKFISVIDGDGQMPIIDLARVYKKITSEPLDIVKTYRLKRGDGLFRKTISTSYNIFFDMLFPGLKSRDINSKPKIFTRDFYQKLKLTSDDWFIDAEIMISARRLKARVGEIPTEFLGLSGKRRSFVRLPAILEFIKNLFVYRIKEFKNKE